MSKASLFEIEQTDGRIFLIYSASNSLMPAIELGKAIVGFEACLREVARVSLLDYASVYIEPIEPGSIKSIFKYVKKHPLAVVVTLDLVVNLFNNSFQLIDRFGASSFRNPSKEILEQISDKKVLDLCRSFDFRSGLQKVAEPISEFNEKAEIIIGENKLNITCDNKYKFYVDKEKESILPELINGEEAIIQGEITRINKKTNELGFHYKGYAISASHIEKDNSIASFHEYLEMDTVKLRGIVIRESDYQVPKIKIIEISKYEDPQLSLFNQEK